MSKSDADYKQPVILFVDDELPILNALKRLLRGTSADILFENSPEKALETLGSQHVDAIISDMRMPGMNGADLLTIVAKQYPSTIRLILSGYSDEELVMQVFEEGQIWGYITKPWDNNELLKTIELICSHLTRSESD